MITITVNLSIDPWCFSFMNYIPTKKNYKYRFDFEIGYLVKSPCRECEIRDAFPGCMKECVVLDRIHEVLSFGISCSKRAS
jgi:hypothetical protein